MEIHSRKVIYWRPEGFEDCPDLIPFGGRVFYIKELEQGNR
jgi:hypothetical protein